MGSASNDHGSRIVASILGAAVAEVATLPVDTTRVRLQLQRSSAAAAAQGQAHVRVHYRGMIHTATHIARNEGPASLFKGLSPALLRQCSYTSLALLFYEPVLGAIAGAGSASGSAAPADVPFWKRLLAGGIAGGVGIAIMNPTEVIKTQMQASVSGTNMRAVAGTIWAQGLTGFWAGVTPNVARCFVGNACELGTYDQAKQELKARLGFEEGVAAHVAASCVAGVASAVACTPIDVVKTRVMNQAGRRGTMSPWQCTSVLIREEGLGALYKGFIPVLFRKVGWVTVGYTYDATGPR